MLRVAWLCIANGLRCDYAAQLCRREKTQAISLSLQVELHKTFF